MENLDIFQQLWFARSNYNSKAIFTFYGKLDPLSFGELRVVSPAQIAEHRTSYIKREITEVEKKRCLKIEFWRNSELMSHLQLDLYFYTTHSILLLRNDSIRKNMLP